MRAYVVVLALLLAGTAAALVAAMLRSRLQFRQLPGVFRCRVRLVRGLLPGVARKWQGRRVWASWTHDVLLVRLGRLPATTRVMPVRYPEGSVTPVSPAEVKGLGSQPLALRLRLDDGDLIEVAVPADARYLVAGPFLVAALTQGSQTTDRQPPSR